MDSLNRTPSWLTGLLVIFTCTSIFVLGLYLLRHARRASLEEQQSRLTLSLVPMRVQEDDLKKQIPLLDKQITDRRGRLDALTEYEKTNQADVDRLVVQNSATLKTNADLLRKGQASYVDLMREAPERRKDLAKEEERAFQSEHDNDERRRQLREDVEKQNQTMENTKKKWRDDTQTQENRIAELEARVRQLTQQLDLSNREFRADGQILASEARDGFVVIDRGLQHNLRKDTKFTIFNKRGGKIVTKGQVQVISVENRLATCRVLEEKDANDPLIAGDYLHNPVYDPDHQRGFVIRGEFTRFSTTEISRFILDAGGHIDAELSVNTDFLVAGGKATTALDQATKLGVSIISEDQLLDFVRRDERPSTLTWQFILNACKNGQTFGFAGRFNQVDEDLARDVIKRNGGRTSGGVSAGYAALVAGDDCLEDMAKARSLGIPVISQAQFSYLIPR